MSSTVDKLTKRLLINPPKWMYNTIQYETITGSLSYGISSDSSDIDIIGFCIPPKDIIFPHLRGEIEGFGRQKTRFDQFQQHHVFDSSFKKNYDITIYNIVKFFSLCMENNPNMLDALFVPERCILHCSSIGNIVRENRKLFLHKGAWPKFKGYSYSQIHKMKNKSLKDLVEISEKLNINIMDSSVINNIELYIRGDSLTRPSELSEVNEKDLDLFIKTYKLCSINGSKLSKRLESIKKFGYDVKFAYHVVRLLNEVEQILTEGDLNLERDREQLKSIRRGDWKEDDIFDYFTQKEKDLEKVYTNSKLPHVPNEDKIKNLLLECLEHYYGSLDECVVAPDELKEALNEVSVSIEKLQKIIFSKTGKITYSK